MVLYVKHNTVIHPYKINTQRSGCFSVEVPETEEEILYEHIFNSIEELIVYYSENKEDIYTKLGRPCLYTSYWEIKQDEIEWKASMSDESNVEHLEGIFGTHRVVAKKLKSLPNPKESVTEEIEVLKRLNQPNISTFYGVIFERVSLTIVTEYLGWKNIVMHFKDEGISHFPINISLSAIRQVLNGLHHLQKNNVVHLNIGARNVLFTLSPFLHCKITNFQIAKRIDISDTLTTIDDSAIRWSAPEVIDSKTLHINSDVWSFGIFIFELFTSCDIPYPNITDKDVIYYVRKGYQMKCPANCPDQLHAIVKECCNLNTDGRPNFESLLPRMRQLTVTLSVDGKPVPVPRRRKTQTHSRPIPKPRKVKADDYENTTFSSNVQKSASPLSHEGDIITPHTISKTKSPHLSLIQSVMPPPLPKRSLNKEYEINRKEVKLISKVGSHLGDEIWDGVWKKNEKIIVTIKKEQLAELNEQIGILGKLQHENVIKLLGVCVEDKSTYILAEATQRRSLLRFLRDNDGALEDEVLIHMAIEVARGMAYLHTHFVIHRDLRADTILLDENNTCKIARFNFVKYVDEDTHTYTAAGVERIAVKWAAPEALSNGVFSTRSDVWSFGIFLYEIVTYGVLPYPGMRNAETLKRVVGGYRMPYPDKTFCPQELYNIMLKCWNEKPDSRPSSVILPQMLHDLLQTEQDEYIVEEEDCLYVHAFDDPPKKDWDIEFSDLTLLTQLEQGKTGITWEGVIKPSTSVAIKCIDTKSMKEDTIHRIEVMKKLKNLNILELHGVCTAGSLTYVVTEFMKHGNIRNYLQNHSYCLETPDLLDLSLQCSKGMAFLEANEIIHGNLSSAKVLVSKNIICKITGMFGTEEDKHSKEFVIKISQKWMAPETAIHMIYQPQSDIWAFGILLYEVMTCGNEPYPGMTDDEVVEGIARGFRMPCPLNCNENVYNIMLKCWNEDPSRRIPFEDIVTQLSDIEVQEKYIVEEQYCEVEEHSNNEQSEVFLNYKLTESTTGDIWKGIWEGENVAIKCPDIDTTDDLFQSFELMKKLTHPNVLKVFVILTHKETISIVMEFMSHGNLQEYIAWEGSLLTIDKQLEISTQCASGMSYLHSQGITHGNLTARNILIGERLSCKITGILGKGIESEDPYSGDVTFYIPCKWMAIETILYNQFSVNSDIWSFGILLYEIMTHGDTPYSGWNHNQVVDMVQKGYRMPCPAGCPNNVHNIMMECWDKVPDQRPPLNDISKRLEDICAYESMPVKEEWPWNICDGDLKRKSKIVDSGSGDIWSGILQGKTEVALKCPFPGSVSTALAIAEVMKTLKHPNIINILGLYSKYESTWVCMEMMDNGNLKNFIKRQQNALSTNQLVHFSAEIACGMMYLEQKGIIHGNLTATKVLVSGNLTCKLTDISGNGVLQEDPYDGSFTFFLPMKWRAPETGMYSDFTMAADVWSFGIVLYEIMSYGRDPYSGMSNATAFEEVQKGYRMDCPPNCPKQVGKVMLDCWNEPDMRPEFDNITLRLQIILKDLCERINTSIGTTRASWEVPRSDVIFEQKLTEGKTGNIWKGLLKSSKPVAIQVVIQKDMDWIKLMMKQKHQNILGIEAVCITSEETLIMTKLMENDNLVNFLRGGGRSLKMQKLTHIAVQISDGTVYLKDQGIVHRDLCARNVLVGEDLTCKITGILADWTDVVEDPYYSEQVYTPPVKWAAPEAALFAHFSFQSDVWSFGIVLYEIVTYGKFPYPGMTRHEVISNIEKGYRMPCPANCPSILYDLMKECWKEHLKERCSAEYVNKILHDYYKELSSVKDEWEVHQDDVVREKKVGESEFGEELWNGQFRHMSVLIKNHSPKMVSLKNVLHEAEVLKMLSHPGIIKLHGICTKSKVIFMVFECVKHCNLLQYIQAIQLSLNHNRILVLSDEIADGMAYLHKQGIIHQYLSASSIMISEKMNCKISNFHQALLSKQGVALALPAMVRWNAVEVLSNNQCSTMSDIWSYGVLLYELASHGQTPYSDMTDDVVCQRVTDGYRMPTPPSCPKGLYDIMMKCWKEGPRHRPTFNEILSSIKSLLSEDKKWETNGSHVIKEDIVGNGRYGEVWRSEWKSIQVAVKYFKPDSCSRDLFLWEADILKTLEHPNVIKLHAVCSYTATPFIIFEIMDTILLKLLRQKKSTLKIIEIVPMTIQIASGMMYLQENKVIHRDLTARSILVTNRNIFKISDFSESIIHGRTMTQAQRDKRLPIRWTAPEAALTKIFTMKSDVWAFGCLLREMVTKGELPYADIRDNKAVIKKVQSGYRMPCPVNCPHDLYQIMLECWREDPEARPSFEVIYDDLKQIQNDLKWEIESNEVQSVKIIGTGRFGEVWEAVYNETSVAVKYHKPIGNNMIAKEFLWEAEILKAVSHPNVIKLIGVNSKAEQVFIVINLMKHGTLLDYLQRCGRTQTVRTLMSMGMQVADGMAYLQTQSIIHRDLAARSILVGENDTCMIADFSEALCTARNDNPDHEGRKFPVKWMPPEAVVDGKFTINTDIWSYGILLYEIVSFGATPYPGMKQTEALEKILKGYRMPRPSGCPEDTYSLMTQCWMAIPSTRPSFETVYLQMQRIYETCRDAPIVRSRTIVGYDQKIKRKRSSTTPEKENWELDRKSLTLDVKYEEGRFGAVWKGYLNGSELVAIKIPKLDHTTVSEFLHESEIMKMLHHPNVISLRGVCSKVEPIYIITEFMANGNMVKYLRSVGRKTVMSQLLTWTGQICTGMSHLEQSSIIHRDVAARNILISQQLICKISDFGLAQKVSGSTYKESSRTQFPLKWMAPEAIRQRLFSFKSDVWAFGILLHEMFTHGALPYPGIQNSDVAQLVKAGYRMPCPRRCPTAIYEIMQNCWKENPEERPNFSAIKTSLISVKSR